MNEPANTDIDRALGFAIPGRSARGRLVRLGPTLTRVLAAHAYPPAIERLLAEALTLTALIGSTLKDADAQLTMQTRSEAGVVRLLVCDYRGGEVRGYVDFDADALAAAPAEPTLFALFGPTYLAITFDLATTGERYQGIVPLDGETLADAAQSYFVQSEQIPTLVRVAIERGVDGETVAGGLFLQHLPEGEDGRERLHTRLDHPEWEHVEALGRTVEPTELAARALPLEELLWRLFNEDEVRLLASTAIVRGCRCDGDYIRSVLAKFGADERREMADEQGLIKVDCHFCSQVFSVPAEVVEARA
ncbi:Hsp33 family molecular chaperone HslO [Sphingomonas sp.]|jgi:molecular chaperone Hsp33|uniref:Hsp33 family molecular chaperone HslO n=1 Tax=Sphingomonas sp. TaxID=28214 RepID=UPI002D7F03EE|nr:Hsp33 family molecular chaperone HslO [Sphingomonas sp.]HEU0044116.1 Hsp33 family molecular chaperone HslO [Sphingomonas sp.]